MMCAVFFYRKVESSEVLEGGKRLGSADEKEEVSMSECQSDQQMVHKCSYMCLNKQTYSIFF